jgi:plastocyanin
VRVTAVAAWVFLGQWAAAQAPPAQPPTAELVGRLELLERGGARVAARDTVVWVPGTTSRAPAPTITSREKRFTPRVVAVAPGASVTFPNVDSIFHNVFSRTPGNEFDLGLYRKGDSRTFRFANPGLVRVYCNIHPNMAAYVMVVEDAAFAVTGEDGAFRLRLPPGRRRVRVWNERSGEKEFVLDLGPGEVKEWTAELDGTTYRRIQHQNKFGKDYPAAGKDADRY